MTEAPKFARWLGALLAAALLAGCTTPTQKPPRPKTSATQAPPPAGLPAAMSDGDAGAPGMGQGYGPASATAAEVEEEEVAADGTTRLISSSTHAATSSRASETQTTVPAGGASPSPSPSARGAGSGALPVQPANRVIPALEGAHFEIPEEVPRPAGDTLNAAPSDGAQDGRVDAAPDVRRGVRGGIDESGASSGTAPLPTARPDQPPPARYEKDVLAQQLREAAQNEKDPALREKLWIEYHNYKAGL